MRANLDGSQVETLVETGRGDKDSRDQTRWCVGITIDPKLGKIYWTHKAPRKVDWAVSAAQTLTFPTARTQRTAQSGKNGRQDLLRLLRAARGTIQKSSPSSSPMKRFRQASEGELSKI